MSYVWHKEYRECYHFLCNDLDNFSSSINNTHGSIIISNYYDTNQLQTFTNLQIKK